VVNLGIVRWDKEECDLSDIRVVTMLRIIVMRFGRGVEGERDRGRDGPMGECSLRCALVLRDAREGL
jgi:hypothetical protein